MSGRPLVVSPFSLRLVRLAMQDRLLVGTLVSGSWGHSTANAEVDALTDAIEGDSCARTCLFDLLGRGAAVEAHQDLVRRHQNGT
jgi:hypothetical protein